MVARLLALTGAETPVDLWPFRGLLRLPGGGGGTLISLLEINIVGQVSLYIQWTICHVSFVAKHIANITRFVTPVTR